MLAFVVGLGVPIGEEHGFCGGGGSWLVVDRWWFLSWISCELVVGLA